jgi:hypothetical protein
MPCNLDRSRPEQNASPAPVSTSTRQLLAQVSSMAAINSACISGVIAFRRSGRFSVIVRIGGLSATTIVVEFNLSSGLKHERHNFEHTTAH